MPKTKTRKRSTASPTQTVRTEAATTRTTTQRPTLPARNNSTSGLIMPAMVALGCWGLAVSFAFFSSEQNHLLFGGMAALMAIMWSVSVGLRVRKMQQRR